MSVHPTAPVLMRNVELEDLVTKNAKEVSVQISTGARKAYEQLQIAINTACTK